MESLQSHARKKEVDALRDLYREQAPRILAYLALYVDDEATCLDLLEATFLDFWKLDRHTPGDPFAALAALARARLSAKLSRLESDAPGESAALAPAETLPGWIRVRRDHLVSALSTLHGMERECLHLALVEDLPAREMSALLQCTEAEVMQRLLLARRRLRKALTGGQVSSVA